LFALIASVVGLASVLAGAHHLTVWRTDSLAASHAAAVIAWLLTLLAFGYVHDILYTTKSLSLSLSQSLSLLHTCKTCTLEEFNLKLPNLAPLYHETQNSTISLTNANS
jgi:H+/Cl- antiporter ClcA